MGAAPRGRQGHAPGMTPSLHLPALLGLGRRHERLGEEDNIVAVVWLTCGARVAAAAREGREARGRGQRAGCLAGPTRARGPAGLRPRVRAGKGLAGRLGWLGREAKQAWATARLPPISSFSVFHFFSFV